MKTKILGGIALLAIAAAMAFNVSLNTDKNNDNSLLALANVEALAGEGTVDKKYQTMGYCTLYGGIELKCTTTVYAKTCTHPCP